jgi:hypothetical protein
MSKKANPIQDCIDRLRLSFQSLEQEASGELEGDRSEGIQAIADSVAFVIGKLEELNKKPTKKDKALRDEIDAILVLAAVADQVNISGRRALARRAQALCDKLTAS